MSLLGKFRRWRFSDDPFPEAWLEWVDEYFPFVDDLDDQEREGFLERLKTFALSVDWVGAHDLEVTDEMKVAIAGSAARIARRLPPEVYDRLSEVVVYPGTFRNPNAEQGTLHLGEAHDWGVVVLSWEAVRDGICSRRDGHDTAIHEFAHVLDREDGSFDGVPVLEKGSHYPAWGRILSARYQDLKEGDLSVLRRYGAENEAEFFAVATESFFEEAEQLRQQAPDLYEQLALFYQLDPAEEPA